MSGFTLSLSARYSSVHLYHIQLNIQQSVRLQMLIRQETITSILLSHIYIFISNIFQHSQPNQKSAFQ